MAASNFKDETGKRFGQLTVIRRAENDNAGKARWLCQCDCGNKCTVSGHNLRLRPNITCGCYRRRQSGLSDTAEYHSWHSMIGRCNNPKSISFHNYGERGISVCHEWYEFKTFLSDMGEMPRKGYSLDRIDNNGNYMSHRIVAGLQGKSKTAIKEPIAIYLLKGKQRQLRNGLMNTIYHTRLLHID